MICLGLGGFKPILDGYTDASMVVGDFDGRKPTWGGVWDGVVLRQIQITKVCFLIFYGRQVHCHDQSREKDVLDETTLLSFGFEARWIETCTIFQQFISEN